MSFEEVIHQKPIMESLLPFLSVIDYINLKRATVNVISPKIPSPEALLLTRFMYRMRHEVGLSDDYIQVITHLLCERDGFYLTGGFLLALLRGDAFDAKKQDVDFFVTEESYRGTFIEAFDPHRAITPEDDTYGMSMDFLRVFDLGQVRVQFIVHESKELSQHSIFHFDIPLCRNLFSKRSGLKLFCLNDITKQSTTIHTVDLLTRVYDSKERTRFTEIYKRNLSRIEKYRHRGFYIRVIVSSKKTLWSSIPIGEDLAREQACRFDRIYPIMKMHNPPSCVYTTDCRCNSEHDEKGKYCTENFDCQCDHHRAFRKEAEAKFIDKRKEAILKEHLDFWSKKNF